MGRLLDVFREHRDTIVNLCQGKVGNIITKLKEHGVLTEEEKNEVPRGNTYIGVYDIISVVEAKGTYTDFVGVLNELGLFQVAQIIERDSCFGIGGWYLIGIFVIVGVSGFFFHKTINGRLKKCPLLTQRTNKLLLKSNLERLLTVAIDSHFVTPLENTSAIVGEECILLCELNKVFAVRWYKNGQELFAGGHFRFKNQRLKHKLIITCLQKDDEGEYTCECGLNKSRCTLTVGDLRVKDRLQNVTIRANQKLTLSCKMNANCKNIEWLKNGGDIPYRAITTVTEDGECTYLYKLEIERAKSENTGDYACRYLNTETRCTVTVMETLLDSSMTTTSLLYELGDAKGRLEQNQNDQKTTETDLAAAQSNVQVKQHEITSTESEIKTCKDKIKKQEEELRQRETELENKENYISELEERRKKLEEYCQDLLQKYSDLEKATEDTEIMQRKIKKLEMEKGELETRVGLLEEYINTGQINAEQRKSFENINNTLLAIIEEQKRSKCVIS